MGKRSRRSVSFAATAAATVLLFAGVAEPSAASPGRPTAPVPPKPYKQTSRCVSVANTRSTLASGVSWAQQQLDYTSLWKLGQRGQGSVIAVIDTGVNPVPALAARLLRGGDYVVPHGDGQADCDGHGTIVAGLIAGSPDGKTGFAGVAPHAEILPVRQSSDYYGPRKVTTGAQQDQTAGTTASLAQAIRFAADSGAEVINISEASCSTSPDDGVLVQHAVNYAVAQGAVIVAAAGNVDQSTPCKQQNTPGKTPVTYPVPADLHNVLAVGAVDENGNPASFSLAGKWVDVAAPGVDIVSTNPVLGGTGQINELTTSSGVTTLQGTSFAAPYVAGLAALIQERFPGISPGNVIRRIEQTAEHPSAPSGRNEYVGYGMIDPTAALTDELPGENGISTRSRTGPQTLPAAKVHHDTSGTRRHIALFGTLGLFVLCLALAIALSTRRRRAEALARIERDARARVGASGSRTGAGRTGAR